MSGGIVVERAARHCSHELGPVIAPVPHGAQDPGDAVARSPHRRCAKEAGIPDGVINCVADRAGSEYLVRHPDIDKVSFTGSALTGSIVADLR